jgi:hypothetical protein
VGRIGSCPSTAVGAAMREHAAATRINRRVLSAAETVPAACAWLHSGYASLPIDRALIHIDSEEVRRNHHVLGAARRWSRTVPWVGCP